MQKKTQKKKENNLNYNKLIKESLRELLGKGLVEGEERQKIDRDFLPRYTEWAPGRATSSNEVFQDKRM